MLIYPSDSWWAGLASVAIPAGAALIAVPLVAAVSHPHGPVWRRSWYGSDAPQPHIEGYTAPGFEAAREAFEYLVRNGWEDNAQVCAFVDGQVVLDLVGCYDRNRPHSRGYSVSSIQNVFSSSKAITSILVAMLVDRGYISYTTPIAEVWAEFSEHDKEDVTLEDLMRHETGLQKFSFVLSAQQHLHRDALKASAHVGEAIASAQKSPDHHSPDLKAATRSKSASSGHAAAKGELSISEVEDRVKSRAYHAVTRGWIENEICMRVEPEGRTLGELLRDWLAGPLGLRGELTLGSETAQNSARIAPLVTISPLWLLSHMWRGFGRTVALKDLFISMIMNHLDVAHKLMVFLLGPTFAQPSFVPGDLEAEEPHMHPADTFNRPEVREAEIPSANCHASARAMARLAAIMAGNGALGGQRIMSERTAKIAQGNPIEKYDKVVNSMTKFTTGGWAVFDSDFGYNRQGSLGWFGIGGSALQWHRELNVGFGYANNLFSADLFNRNSAIVQNVVIDCARAMKKNN